MQPSSATSEHADPPHRHPPSPLHPPPTSLHLLCTGTHGDGGHPPGAAAIGTQHRPSHSLVCFRKVFLSLLKSQAWLYYDNPRLVFVWGEGVLGPLVPSLWGLQLGTPQAGLLPALPFCSRCPGWPLPCRGSQARARTPTAPQLPVRRWPHSQPQGQHPSRDVPRGHALGGSTPSPHPRVRDPCLTAEAPASGQDTATGRGCQGPPASTREGSSPTGAQFPPPRGHGWSPMMCPTRHPRGVTSLRARGCGQAAGRQDPTARQPQQDTSSAPRLPGSHPRPWLCHRPQESSGVPPAQGLARGL